MKKFITFTDGGARGNPGHAGIGVVIQDGHGAPVKLIGRYIGETTNNQAEYQALHLALEESVKLGASDLECFLDSELVVKQMKGEYKVKDKNLGVWFIKIWNLRQRFQKIQFFHVPREKNKEADRLVNEAIDAHLKR